ncbi:Ribosomal RNA small subunit methyltransferase A [Legionella massiliensis]|uniref:Ribosomal RNA small subunit methyltransferase A n=1 Tax=Legionella massiliensis TaxID=1034943 RepID=A0A078KTF8_9GAMM|nr:16S rRNA (adenine(1518)-N(6)/adenine(1519)-N(6))-dimethyltransferase RsmA [Legionella massiliensis]CDZ76252.1 Ribosomal RNA small subunit methyltransferase A [Legionella massiliensis]CEE11990.1 Ribosomal RNA small subunit methyltransferase A [Legionella massiliensis]
MSHRPRKRFGQNFLQNQHTIAQILSALHLQKDDKVIEIGPGLGALTQPLLKYLDKLIAIEIDTDLQAHLSSLAIAQNKLDLIPADALTVDYSQWGSGLRVVGNLPYNISTPLLLHLLDYVASINDMHFMLQKEVVERLAAQPGTKDYGRLTVIVQYHCEVESLFEVPPEAFHPKPKVDSAVVRLIPHQASPYPVVEVSALEKLVAKAFSMRRKTLANNLKPVLSATQLSDLGIDPLARPEQISVRDYVQITKFITA